MGKKVFLLVLACLLVMCRSSIEANLSKDNVIGSKVISQIGVVVRDIEKSSKA